MLLFYDVGEHSEVVVELLVRLVNQSRYTGVAKDRSDRGLVLLANGVVVVFNLTDLVHLHHRQVDMTQVPGFEVLHKFISEIFVRYFFLDSLPVLQAQKYDTREFLAFIWQLYHVLEP